jgi:prepilin-type N-terminal cleavage/methylation domain-containing protein
MKQTFDKSQAGWTLIEIIVTIVIFGIMATILTTKYINLIETGKRTACLSNQCSLVQAQSLFYAENYVKESNTGAYATDPNQLVPYVTGGVIPKCPKGPDYILLANGMVTCPLSEHKM